MNGNKVLATGVLPSAHRIASQRPALPEQQICLDVLAAKYLQPGESTIDAVYCRVADALASVESTGLRSAWQRRFLTNLRSGAIGAGRIMHAAGTQRQATLINCFVQPINGGAMAPDRDAYPDLQTALRQAELTLKLGGGVGYDFSRLPPRAAHIQLQGVLRGGVCRQIDRFDQLCTEIGHAGSRRGAQMAVLRIDHPDIFEFVSAKRMPGRWKSFNLALAVTDQFMHAIEAGAQWQLVHWFTPRFHRSGNLLNHHGLYQRADGLWVYRTLPATELWEVIMRAAYALGEPGVLFIDRIRTDDNLRSIESIEATNPCGEQPLPAYGACDLGPLILPRFVRRPFGMGGAPYFEFKRFADAVKVQVRALDNVLDLSLWPLPQQQAEAQSKRRIGVGFTGLGTTLTMMKLRYDSDEGRAMAAKIAECMRDAAYQASIALATEKACFPLLNRDQFLEAGTFASRLPIALQTAIRTYGLRNSHLLSIAPAGSVSLAFADNVSNGIEPSFGWTYRRNILGIDGQVRPYMVEDYAWRRYRALGGDISALPDWFVSALELSADAHIAMVQAVQPYIDAGISKTANLPADYPYSTFKGLYQRAWVAKLKGLSTFRQQSPLGEVLTVVAPASATVQGRGCAI